MTIFLSQLGYLEFMFTEMFIEMLTEMLQKYLLSSTFHMSFVQITEFDWLPGRQKG